MQTAIFMLVTTITLAAEHAEQTGSATSARSAFTSFCIEALEQQRRVGAAEAERVRQRVLDRERPRLTFGT